MNQLSDLRPEVKCIVLDLDGTLLNSERSISTVNLQTIQSCKKNGIHIVVATARPPRAVRHLLSDESFNDYVIYYNGALVTNESDGIYDHIHIPAEISVKITDFVSANAPRSIISYEVDNAWFSTQAIPEGHYSELGIRASDPKPEIIEKQVFRSLSPTKILILGFKEWRTIKDYFGQYVNVVCTDDGLLVQIMNRNVSKENAVRRILDDMGILPQETMVFGDDFNDIGLFELCGFPVAMGNAISELKALAKFVTKSNDDDGIAFALQKFVLQFAK